MPSAARERFEAELANARTANDTEAAWAALTTAHLLAQQWAGPHVRSHVAMLRQGVAERDAREVAGQLVRILVAAPGSWRGRTPVGNSGRADVPLMATAEVPAHVAALLEPAGPEP